MSITDTNPHVEFPVSASDASTLAVWWTRYAIDRVDSDPCCSDPVLAMAVKAHATAAPAQHIALGEAVALIHRSTVPTDR
jgi:hypothetical protein